MRLFYVYKWMFRGNDGKKERQTMKEVRQGQSTCWVVVHQTHELIIIKPNLEFSKLTNPESSSH